MGQTDAVPPPFEIVARLRPVDLVSPWTATAHDPAEFALPRPAPYAAITGTLNGDRASLSIESGAIRLTGRYDAGRFALEVTDATGARTVHASRRRGTAEGPVDELALTLTGTILTVFGRESGRWVGRARYALGDRVDVRDETFLAGLEVRTTGDLEALSAGGFGQLGLRDLRFVTTAEGAPYRDAGRLWLTATHAGPGFFDAAHTGVWSFDPDTCELDHHADLFFRRPDSAGVYGDNATHLVRDDDRWLVATSTWGDFDHARPAVRVSVTLAESRADLLRGTHVLDTRHLELPTDGFTSVGVWDPHLVRIDGRWHVGFVSARKYFAFHPVLAAGPTLDDLTLVAADTGRRATEGTTLVRLDEGWRLLASDGRDGRRGQRARYPVFDLALTELGELDAPYPTNLPWPNLARVDDGWLMVTFDGRPTGSDLLGYGTHGAVLVLRSEGRNDLVVDDQHRLDDPPVGVDA